MSGCGKRAAREVSGFIELGMLADAEERLRALEEAQRRMPAVMACWCELAAARQDWPEAQRRARALAETHPDSGSGWFWLGFAARRVVSPRAAWEAMRPARGRFPDEPVVDYNLACYACLCGEAGEARAILEPLLAKWPEWREVALRDQDLAPLHRWIGENRTAVA